MTVTMATDQAVSSAGAGMSSVASTNMTTASMPTSSGMSVAPAIPSGVGPVLRPGANVLPQAKMDIQPPVMGRNFELYAVRLQTYLTRMNLWTVVSGVEQRGSLQPLAFGACEVEEASSRHR